MVSLTVEIHGHRSVREACRVMDQIRKDIREKLENVLDVLIQVAPAGAFAAQVQDMGLEKVNDEDLL
jgi:divalent metal cation (Fe/Co/Zn/Cd) transporter